MSLQKDKMMRRSSQFLRLLSTSLPLLLLLLLSTTLPSLIVNAFTTSVRKSSSSSTSLFATKHLKIGLFGGGTGTTHIIFLPFFSMVIMEIPVFVLFCFSYHLFYDSSLIFFTVGGGVVQILQQKKEYFEKLTDCTLDIVKICVNDINKERDFIIPDGTTLTTNYDDILNDPNIDVVVEVMGGTDDAKNVVYTALKNHKTVVTANKALIAKHLPEIEKILNDVNKDSKDFVEFRYEAAVCGGIPIIRSMQSGTKKKQCCSIYIYFSMFLNHTISYMDTHHFFVFILILISFFNLFF